MSKTSPPIAAPIPIGISMLKFKLDTADKYNVYLPISIRITVLLIPGTTMPTDIKAPAMTNEPKEAELLCIKETLPENSRAIRYMLKENARSKEII